ncbi:MAG: alpha/beta hydrolase [Gammaproteobacteria bacterium]
MKLLVLLSIFLTNANINIYSAVIKHKLPNGFTSSAEYRIGEKDKPAVFILHGLLQTRNYLTVQSLITAISDEGYTVLAPNLSLSISNRKKSLPCEAIHNHDMKQDIDEIDYWVKWLEKKGHTRISLVGHSFGSLQLVIYANTKKPKSVTHLITTSLIDVEETNDHKPINSFVTKARKQIKNNDTQLHEYQISYCKKYISPASNYLSYARWTKDKLITELNKLTIPITIILGSTDKRLDNNWISMLKKSKLELIMIQGANHFFDKSHEFDLNDSVLDTLVP